MELLLDVDRWDRAEVGAQDRAIAEVARRVHATIEWVGIEQFIARKHKIRRDPCADCDGWGGVSPQSGGSDHPDCETCNNTHVIEHPYQSEPLAHRVAVFRHRATGLPLVLVPGRLEIAACLVARPALDGDVAPGLRLLTAAETRHAYVRGGSFDLAFEDGTWREHPFGLLGDGARAACAVPGLEDAQGAAFHALIDELGPIDPYVPPGCLVRTCYGTADPPRSLSAIAFSPDGRWLATAAGRELRVWDAANGRQLSRFTLANAEGTESIAFAPDNARLVVASQTSIEVFEHAIGQSIARLGAGRPASRLPARFASHSNRSAVAWLPDGRLLIAEATTSGGNTAWLSLVDPETGELVRAAEWPFDGYLWSLELATSIDGARAAVSVLQGGMLAVWDVTRWEVERRIALDGVSSLAIGTDRVFTSYRDQIVSHAVAPADDAAPVLLGTGSPSSIMVSPDGQCLAWRNHHGVGVTELVSGTRRTCPVETMTPFAFSRDGARLASGIKGHVFAAIWPGSRFR